MDVQASTRDGSMPLQIITRMLKAGQPRNRCIAKHPAHALPVRRRFEPPIDDEFANP